MSNSSAAKSKRKKPAKVNPFGQRVYYPRCIVNLDTTVIRILTVHKAFIVARCPQSLTQPTSTFVTL